MANILSVECADISGFRCDVIVLKYAQEFFGADALVAGLLTDRSPDAQDISPLPNQHVLLSSNGRIAARRILFVGVLELYRFDYEQIREFATRSLAIVARQVRDARHVAMTMHGVGYGLDEREAFLAQVGGLAKKGDELKFDVRGQRCIVYKSIADLAKRLEADLTSL